MDVYVRVRFWYMDVAVERVQYLCRPIRNTSLNCHVVDEL